MASMDAKKKWPLFSDPVLEEAMKLVMRMRGHIFSSVAVGIASHPLSPLRNISRICRQSSHWNDLLWVVAICLVQLDGLMPYGLGGQGDLVTYDRKIRKIPKEFCVFCMESIGIPSWMSWQKG